MKENIIDLAYETGRKDGVLDMLETIEIVAGVVSEFEPAGREDLEYTP